MHSVVFLVPGRIDVRTGGTIYDRRITEGLREHGWLVEVRAGRHVSLSPHRRRWRTPHG